MEVSLYNTLIQGASHFKVILNSERSSTSCTTISAQGWRFFILIVVEVGMNTEDRLLSAARKMDKEALAEIFDLYAYALYKYALRYCNDTLLADQIVGDVFSKLLEKLVVGKGPRNNLRSYLFEITFNLIVDETRYVSRRTPIEVVDTHAYNGSSTDLNIENQMDLEKISRTIKSLSPDQRHVIILRFLEGFSLSETAAILKKTVGCVKITQFRAIWNLRVALGMDPQVSASSPETGTGLGTV